MLERDVAMNRYLDTLFRNKQVFLIPLVATPLMALLVMLYLGTAYQVEALIWAQPSQLFDPMRDERSSLAANERESQAIQEWLETEAFRKEVMDQVGLTAAIMGGQWPAPSRMSLEAQRLGLTQIWGLRQALRPLGLVPPDDTQEALDQALGMVRKTLSVSAEGQNLMRITYRGPEPALGQAMVEQVINLYRERVLRSRTQEAQMGIDFYGRQLQIQEARLHDSSEQYRQFLESHPAPIPGQLRPASEEATLEALRRAYQLEQSLYESYLRRLDEVRIESEAAISNRDITFQVVDHPQQPEVAAFSATTIGTTLIIGILLGAILGTLPIVAMTALDGSVRTTGDIEQIAAPPFVAQVPLIPVKGRQGDGVRSILAHGITSTATPSISSPNGREKTI
jgi:uncharacterized protein involved in exopolysaccharide biosynthesis